MRSVIAIDVFTGSSRGCSHSAFADANVTEAAANLLRKRSDRKDRLSMKAIAYRYAACASFKRRTYAHDRPRNVSSLSFATKRTRPIEDRPRPALGGVRED